MSVYVDDARNPLGRMVMCHMVADSEEELHGFAKKLGLRRGWFQLSQNGVPHYDICMAKRRHALTLGAKTISQREVLAFKRRKAK